jgi:peptidoglycan/LPS O-acetylase OafA/YrhL
MLTAFALGMTGALICFRQDAVMTAWRKRPSWLPTSTALGILTVLLILIQRKRFEEIPVLRLFQLDVNGAQYGMDLLVALWSTALIIGYTLWLMREDKGSNRPPFLLRVFQQPWSVTLGSFSYSLYLIHMPILGLAELITRRYVTSGLVSCFLIMVLGPLLSVVTAYGFFLVVESRFLNTTRAKSRQGQENIIQNATVVSPPAN